MRIFISNVKGRKHTVLVVYTTKAEFRRAAVEAGAEVRYSGHKHQFFVVSGLFNAVYQPRP